MTTTPDYEARLVAAREWLQLCNAVGSAHPLDVHTKDQADAAVDHARALIGRAAAAEHLTDATRFPSPDVVQADVDPQEAFARVCAAQHDGHRWRVCPHLRRNAVQLTFMRLPIRRIDCQRCAATVVAPPAEDDDRCDLCGEHGHTIFWPLQMQLATMLVLGDACQPCAAAIGVPTAQKGSQ